MSRAALPGSRGKEKDRPNARDRSSKWSREPKVDQVFENTDETTIQGGEFSADEENQEEELYKRIVSERNIARPSKNNDSQVKGKSGVRVRRTTEERDENEDRNKPVKKTVSQQPQQQEVFTTAFQLQLGILIVVVVLSLLAHYFLFTHLYRNLRVSESQQNHFKRTDNNQNYDIDSKVDEAIKSKLNQTDIVNRVQNTLSVELNKFDISGNVKQKIEMELSDVDIDKKVKDSLKPEVLKIVEETKSTKVEIEQLLQSAKVELDQERVKFNAQLETYQGRIVEAVEDATNIKTLIPNAKEMNKLQEKIDEMAIKYSKIMVKETDDLKIGKLQVSVKGGERKLEVVREEFGELQKNIAKAIDEYAKHKDKIKEIEKIKEKLDVIQPNTFNKESFMMAFMILTVMVCVLAVAVFNIYQRGSSTEPVHTNERTQAKRNTKDMGSNDVLRRIPQSPNLQPGVCIISYDEARAGFHRELFDSANIPKCDVKYHVIRRHEQILELPKCKVYLMCTEFSERHVIIEESGLGLGDLHRTTYYAVKKLGGCLIILYTKDPGSRKLRNQANQALYNTDIYCVKKQQELSDLEQNNGFYSTYDKLSEHQKTVLRQKIVDNMT